MFLSYLLSRIYKVYDDDTAMLRLFERQHLFTLSTPPCSDCLTFGTLQDERSHWQKNNAAQFSGLDIPWKAIGLAPFTFIYGNHKLMLYPNYFW